MVILCINHHDGKIYRTDATGTLKMKKQVFLQTSSNRFFNYKTVVSILIASLLMVLLFSSLAKSYAKTVELQDLDESLNH
jgi:F-type H+-transporting ATPase subunit a